MTMFTAEGHRPAVALQPGDSVQDAVDAAPPGGVVELAEGVFTQQVHIRRSDVTLRGAGAGRTVFEPPSMPRPLDVPGLHEGGADAVSGIAVHRDGDGAHHVTLTGLTVRGFPGAGIYAHSVGGLTVRDCEVAGNAVWGLYAYACSDVTIAGVTASGSQYAGVGISFSPHARARITDVVSTDNGYGVFIDNSSQGEVRRSTTTGNCCGILLLNQVYPGEPAGGVEDWLVTDNSVSDNGRACGVDREGPGANGAPISGSGIALVGTRRVVVVGNRIFANVPTAHSVLPAGLAVTSSAEFGGSDPEDNQLLWNDMVGNQPLDLLVDGDTSRQTLTRNRAAAVHPAELPGVLAPEQEVE